MCVASAAASLAAMTGSLSLRTALLGAVGLTGALEATYYFGGTGGVADDTPLRAALVATVGAALTAALLWRWCRGVYARGDAGEIGSRSVWLGGLAVLSLLGFWIGLFGPAAASAVVFGRAALGAGRRRAGWFAIAVGALVALAGAVACVLGAS
jgi:hypothetical protein